jgi:hypothetical protein
MAGASTQVGREGERINANISLGEVDPYRLVSSDRHCLDADAPCTATILVHPQSPEFPK